METQHIFLDPKRQSPLVKEFEAKLRARIVGQDEAVAEFVSIYQTFMAGMSTPNRPVANLLLLGPTGSGKTRLVEVGADILFGSPQAFIKVDCAEFQHSHEIAKLIGSPPGYIGHRDTKPTVTQEALDQFHTDTLKISFLLFDEIEKASDALWQLLLGILDKGVLTLGDNTRVDLSRTVVFMTSNLGASEMSKLVGGGIGFAPITIRTDKDLAGRMFRVAVDAARRRFSPEFMNRIDKVIVFRTLTPDHLRRILEIELNEVHSRILSSLGEKTFELRTTPKAREFLLKEGTDLRYGARHLKRAIERHLVFPLSSLMSSGQIEPGEIIVVDAEADNSALTFSKERTKRRKPQEPPAPPARSAESGES